MDLGDTKMTEEDLVRLEKKMNELVETKQCLYYARRCLKHEATEYFTEKGDEYKLDLLENLKDGEITFYTQGILPICAAARIFRIPVLSKQ